MASKAYPSADGSPEVTDVDVAIMRGPVMLHGPRAINNAEIIIRAAYGEHLATEAAFDEIKRDIGEL
jgi:hypothetical protein